MDSWKTEIATRTEHRRLQRKLNGLVEQRRAIDSEIAATTQAMHTTIDSHAPSRCVYLDRES